MSEDIKGIVKEKYARAALRVTAAGGSSCCGSTTTGRFRSTACASAAPPNHPPGNREEACKNRLRFMTMLRCRLRAVPSA